MADPDPRTPDLAAVQRAYERWSVEYTAAFGSVDTADAEDRATIAAWAASVGGPVLDAGCGPGHWSAFLRSLGLQVEGVDATAAFVQHAAVAHPGIPFRVADLRVLAPPPASLGGVLAWFSLIHLDPGEVPQVLRRFAAALRPGGSLLVGFFSGADLRPFDHRVVTAWAWPVERMAGLLAAAGLEVLTRGERPGTGDRVLAEVTARRPSRTGRAPVA